MWKEEAIIFDWTQMKGFVSGLFSTVAGGLVPSMRNENEDFR